MKGAMKGLVRGEVVGRDEALQSSRVVMWSSCRW